MAFSLVSLSLSLYNIVMCCKPLVLLKYGIDEASGNAHTRIKRVPLDYDLESFMSLYPKGTCYLVPCGSCPECVLKYRKEWSVRCTAEAESHLINSFLTLTYDDDHYNSSNKKDLQEFLQHLRNWKIKFRYFACGEHGFLGRFHYHVCLFGYRPDDLVYHSLSKSGEVMYTSKFLERIWDKGFVRVQDYGPKTAQYVAGYVSKKIDKESFLMMSTHPGLGYDWYQAHKQSIYRFDKLYLNIDPSGNCVPRYFVKLLEKDGFDLEEFKAKRMNKSVASIYEACRQHGFTFIDMNYSYKEYFAQKKLNKLRRSL